MLRPGWRQDSCTSVLLYKTSVLPYNCSKQSACTTRLDKNDVARSIWPRSKNFRNGPLFFNFKGTLFADLFDTSKKKHARTFPSFSHDPHLKKEELGKMLQLISIRGRRLQLCIIVLSKYHLQQCHMLYVRTRGRTYFSLWYFLSAPSICGIFYLSFFHSISEIPNPNLK